MELDPDLSVTFFLLGAFAVAVALPVLVLRIPPELRRLALGVSLVAASAFAIWMAIQPVNAGLEWPLLFIAGLAIADAALLFFVPRVASVLAVLFAVLALVGAGLGARLIARSFMPLDSEGLAAFSGWILFAGVYIQVVFGFGVFASRGVHQGRAEGAAPAGVA